ncbi:hypothetical protein ACFFRR_001923 [Megaselia abdita]
MSNSLMMMMMMTTTKLATTAAATICVHHFRHVLDVPNEHLRLRSPHLDALFFLVTFPFQLFVSWFDSNWLIGLVFVVDVLWFFGRNKCDVVLTDREKKVEWFSIRLKSKQNKKIEK